MKLKERNYLGFNHAAVKAKFEGDLTFICEMPVEMRTQKGSIMVPCAVYKSANPDRAKGHKDYMLLFYAGDTYYVSGRNEIELLDKWTFEGIHCKKCGEVLVSLDRHDYYTCGCENSTMIDGGTDYTRCGAMDLSQTEMVSVNFKTGEIIPLTQRG